MIWLQNSPHPVDAAANDFDVEAACRSKIEAID
jgi:hypothetical protein